MPVVPSFMTIKGVSRQSQMSRDPWWRTTDLKYPTGSLGFLILSSLTSLLSFLVFSQPSLLSSLFSTWHCFSHSLCHWLVAGEILVLPAQKNRSQGQGVSPMQCSQMCSWNHRLELWAHFSYSTATLEKIITFSPPPQPPNLVFSLLILYHGEWYLPHSMAWELLPYSSFSLTPHMKSMYMAR